MMGRVSEVLVVCAGMVAAEMMVVSRSWRKRGRIEAEEVVQDRCLIACAVGSLGEGWGSEGGCGR